MTDFVPLQVREKEMIKVQDPKKVKKLGREVKPFTAEEWDKGMTRL